MPPPLCHPTTAGATILAPTAAFQHIYPGDGLGVYSGQQIVQASPPGTLNGYVLGSACLVVDGVVRQILEGAPPYSFQWTPTGGSHTVTAYVGGADADETGVWIGGAAQTVVGVYGAYFDGAAQLKRATDSNLSFTTAPYAAGCWIKPDAVSAINYVMCKASAVGDIEWSLGFNDLGQAFCAIRTNNAGGTSYNIHSANNKIVAGVWQHLMFTVVSTTMTLYVNGVSVGTTTIAGNINHPNTIDFSIGSDVDGLFPYAGIVDEPGLWKSAVSVSSIYNSGAGKRFAQLAGSDLTSLVGYYDLNESTGQSRSDASGNGETLSDVGVDPVQQAVGLA